MKKFLLAAMTCAAIGSAQASLVSQDYLTAGDGKLTHDTATGLNWLDVSETAGLSVVQILSGTGGWSAHFRIATRSEVLQLMADAGLTNTPNNQSSNYAPAIDFVSLFNTAGNACNTSFACGAFLGDGSNVDVINIGTNGLYGFAYDYENYYTQDFASSIYGVMLIQQSTSAVPEPGGLALVGLALAGLAGAARRRQRTS